MEKQWWCVSCLAEIELDTHGRCSACGSNAVDRIGHGARCISKFRPKNLFWPCEPAQKQTVSGVPGD